MTFDERMRISKVIPNSHALLALLLIGQRFVTGTDFAIIQNLSEEECFIPDISAAFYHEVGLEIEQKKCYDNFRGELPYTQHRYIIFESDHWIRIDIKVTIFPDEWMAASRFQDHLRDDCFWSRRNTEREWHKIGGTDFTLHYEVVFKEEEDSESIWRLIHGDTIFSIEADGFDFRESDYWTRYRDQLTSVWEQRQREFMKKQIEQGGSGNPDKPDPRP